MDSIVLNQAAGIQGVSSFQPHILVAGDPKGNPVYRKNEQSSSNSM